MRSRGHVVQTDAFQETQPPLNLLQDLVADGLLPCRQRRAGMLTGSVRVYVLDPVESLAYVLGADVHDPQLADLHCQGFGTQTLAVAGAAGAGCHVPLYVLAGVFRVGLFVPPFQVGDHAFE